MATLFVALQTLIPHHALSRLVGWLIGSPLLKSLLIRGFMKLYRVDLSEAKLSDPKAYSSFNDFFARRLRSGARPVSDCPETIHSPADGLLSQLGPIRSGSLVQAKGHSYDVVELLANDRATAALFDSGYFATVYLAPGDYHRVHMPISGRLLQTRYVPGRLFSVNTTTAARVPRLFARNERLVCLFETAVGPVVVILVGAMLVGAIDVVWAGRVCPRPMPRTVESIDYRSCDLQLDAGGELGHFALGSTVILLFGRDGAELDSALQTGCRVCAGQPLARCTLSIPETN